MTKAEHINLTNLMDNVRKIEKATVEDNNRDEIERIRQYCIDAVNDYNETSAKICELINNNRDLYPNPYIKGSYQGFVDGKHYSLSSCDYGFGHFVFNTGSFHLFYCDGCSMYVNVGGIEGTKKRTGYCGAFEDHDLNTKNWKAESVSIDNTAYNSNMPWYNDLIMDSFYVNGDNRKRLPYSVDNLRKYKWDISGWTALKAKADKTKKRTEALVSFFKKSLEKRIKESTDKLNSLTESSQASVYVKVQF